MKIIKMSTIKVPQHINDLKAYKAGKSLETLTQKLGLTEFAKLSSNENPFGPSPLALKAAQASLSQQHLYPDPSAYTLRHKLTEKLNLLNANQVCCGAGIDSILSYIMMAFSHEGDEILTSQGSFIGVYVNANKLGRNIKAIPQLDWAYDLNSIFEAINTKTKIIYLANPNNPTGKMITQQQLEMFLQKIPSHILVVLDEAYYEYACHHRDYPNGTDYINHYNILVTRTFSKAYGLAGSRVGYVMGNENLIATLNKVKLPFEPSRLAQAMASAALDDDTFLQKTQAANIKGIAFFIKTFEKLGLNFVSNSGGNSLMLLFKTETQTIKFYDACFNLGLIMRPLKSFGIPTGIRINTGTAMENSFAAGVITKVFHSLIQCN